MTGQKAPVRVGIIAPYPPEPARHSGLNGVAPYTHNLVEALLTSGGRDVTVIADVSPRTLRDETSELETAAPQRRSGSAPMFDVVRCWRQNPAFPVSILAALRKRRRALDVIHVQHEYAQFGGAYGLLAFPVLLLLLRALKCPVVVTMHGTVRAEEVNGAFCRRHFLRVSPFVARIAFHIVNRSIASLADRVIVHSNLLKRALVREAPDAESRIVVIPHGVESRNDLIGHETAKSELNATDRKVILFFGHIAGYKGLGVMVEALGALPRDEYLLLVVGGRPVRMDRDPEYDEFLRGIEASAGEARDDIRFAGHVPESEFPRYFCAADVVVFPYVSVNAASGALCLALAYRRPVLVSELVAESLTIPAYMSFKPTAGSLAQAITSFFEDPYLQHRALIWQDEYSSTHSWASVASRTAALYDDVAEKKEAA